AGRASGRATCTARSAARGRRDRPRRGSGEGGPCRSGASAALLLLDVLRHLEPAFVDELVVVDDGVEDPAERHVAAGLPLELSAKLLDRQGADRRADLPVLEPQADRDGAVSRRVRPLESRVERGLEVVEAVEREVQTG